MPRRHLVLQKQHCNENIQFPRLKTPIKGLEKCSYPLGDVRLVLEALRPPHDADLLLVRPAIDALGASAAGSVRNDAWANTDFP